MASKKELKDRLAALEASRLPPPEVIITRPVIEADGTRAETLVRSNIAGKCEWTVLH